MKKSQHFRDAELNIPHLSWAVFLTSVIGLFLEILFIRWVGTEIRIFAYLQNTILVVCFLGLGIGMFTSTRRIDMRESLAPMAILLFFMAIPATRLALGSASEMLSTLGDLNIWESREASDTGQKVVLLSAGLALTYGALVLIVDIFVPIGRMLGRLMNAHTSPIWAYSVNIFGSILGTWTFVLFSFFNQPPYVWFLGVGILIAILIIWTNHNKAVSLAILVFALILSWFASQVPGTLKTIWSPYQKLSVREGDVNWFGDFHIDVNNVGYQVIIDLSNERVTANPEKFVPQWKGLSQYDLPLLLHPSPRSFLIVGAGAGNDTAGALRHNVESVTAVEIDPVIISLGQDLHPESPYSSSKVQVVNDDARSFFATTTEKYDVISFGLLDSHTTTAMTNARLDHYVYTRESILQAKSRLEDGGIMVLTFEAQKPFIADRIQIVLEEVFGKPPLVFRIPLSAYGAGGVMFVTGDLENVQRQLDRNERLAAHIEWMQTSYPIQLDQTTRITTDDWPYLYLEDAKIPSLYYLLIGLMILIFARSYRKWQAAGKLLFVHRSFWHFFFLGAAFLLLEVQNISKASVVLGNTWQVNTVIISGILGMALLANWIANKFPKLPLPPIYFLLVATSLALYFVDLARFGFMTYPLKAAIVGVLTSLPMLFSGIVFVRSFAVAPDKSNALGANLIGALVGALLQSITFVTGIKALLLVVGGFYLLALFTAPPLPKTDESASPEFAK